MTAFALLCDGTVAVTPEGGPLCNGTWVLQAMPTPFSLDQLDPVLLGQAVVAGYSLVLTLWLTSRGIKALLDLFRSRFPF